MSADEDASEAAPPDPAAPCRSFQGIGHAARCWGAYRCCGRAAGTAASCKGKIAALPGAWEVPRGKNGGRERAGRLGAGRRGR